MAEEKEAAEDGTEATLPGSDPAAIALMLAGTGSKESDHAGKPDEARKHFARAAALDLTPSEKSELARIIL